MASIANCNKLPEGILIYSDMGVSIVIGGTPSSLDGLFHGKIKTKMDDLGVPPFQETPV